MLKQRIDEVTTDLQKLAMRYGLEYDQFLKYLSDIETKHSLFSSSMPEYEEENINYKFGKKRQIMKTSCFAEKGNNENKENGSKQNEESLQTNEDVLLIKNLGFVESSLLEINNLCRLIMENVVEIVATKKPYKIRQNFRDLVLKILNVPEIAFYICHESGRVQFQDFSSNYITEILETDPKCLILEKIFQSNSEEFHLVDAADNNEYMKIFQINSTKIERNQFYGTAMSWSMGDEEQTFSVSLMIRNQQNQNQEQLLQKITPKLLKKIVEICLISTSEESNYIISKSYAKKMLDLLEILIIQCELRLKKILCRENKLPRDNYYSLTNLVKIIIEKLEWNITHENLVEIIKKMANRFEELQYQKIEEIRMYKRYTRENGTILIEFNSKGVLQFLSNNKEIKILNELTRIWEPEKPIFELLFENNQKLEMIMKKALRSSCKSERPFEIADNIKVRFISHLKKIQKIHVLLEDTEESSQNNSHLESRDSKTKTKFKAKTKNHSDKVLSSVTIKQIEKDHPGVSDEGWLDLFLKNNNKSNAKKQERQRSLSKKNKNIIIKHDCSPPSTRARNHTLSISSALKTDSLGIENIELENLNINFLTFNDEELDRAAIKILERLDFYQEIGISKHQSKLQNFINQLHDHYEIHSNSFHNFKHGVNVMHTCYLLSTMQSNVGILSMKDIFAIVFSGLCHDVGHTGFTNAYQIASQSKKAILYNDKSPLENYHASLTFQLLRKEENNFLQQIQREQITKFRQSVIENILFTDIKEHFPMLKNFNDLINSGKTFESDNASLLSSIIVHSSDFGGSIRNFEICKQWSFRVNTEFSNQYKMEGELGLPQTPFMKDLNDLCVLSKAEGGFLKVIVYPLYQALGKLYLTENIVHKFKKNVEQNIKEWEKMFKIESQKALKKMDNS